MASPNIKEYRTAGCVDFIPKHPEKYVGKDKRVICRSSWEGRFCVWLDNHPDVIGWCSECIAIKYQDPVKPFTKAGKPYIRSYFPDFFVTMRVKDGSVKRYLVEIKPEKETKPPRKTPGKTPKTLLHENYTFAINSAKWRAATNWCLKNDVEFKIITEKSLPGAK